MTADSDLAAFCSLNGKQCNKNEKLIPGQHCGLIPVEKSLFGTPYIDQI